MLSWRPNRRLIYTGLVEVYRIFLTLSPPHYEMCHQSHNSLPDNKKKILLSTSKKQPHKSQLIVRRILIADVFKAPPRIEEKLYFN